MASEVAERLVSIHSLYTWTKRYGVPEEERKAVDSQADEMRRLKAEYPGLRGAGSPAPGRTNGLQDAPCVFFIAHPFAANRAHLSRAGASYCLPRLLAQD